LAPHGGGRASHGETTMDLAPTQHAGAGSRRRRRTGAVAASLVAFAVAAGAAVAVLARHGSPGSADGTFFVPGAALGIAPAGTAAGSGGAGFSAPSVAAPGALPLGPQAQGVASPIGVGPGVAATAGTAAGFPWWGAPCNASGPTQLSGSLLVATGTAPLAPGTGQAHYALNAGINEQATSGDVAKAVAQARTTVDVVVAALAHAGVPSSAIHPSFISVWASGGKPVAPATPEP